MNQDDGRAFADNWATAWNQRAVEQVLAHFDDEVVFTSPTAVGVVGTPIVRGKAALRSYWTAALARIESLRFEVDHVLWDDVRQELAIIYTATINGQARRASENLRFNQHDTIVEAEVFHGIVITKPE